METLKKIFLNKKIVLSVILLNAVIIFFQEWDYKWDILNISEFACSVFFLIEMITKIQTFGFFKYWQSGWNKLDGILVIISLPSIIEYFIPLDMINLSILLVLRVLRILRIFKTMHFFPSFSKVISGFKLAISRSYAVLLSFFVIVVIFSLINCSIFGDIVPELFGNPLTSVYSMFRLCTVEGWYDIPDKIAEASSPLMGTLTTGYFCFLLIMGGIIGMSFINSVFVDAMVSDNNDEVKEQLDRMEAQIENLKKLLENTQNK